MTSRHRTDVVRKKARRPVEAARGTRGTVLASADRSAPGKEMMTSRRRTDVVRKKAQRPVEATCGSGVAVLGIADGSAPGRKQ